jgi:predicted AAA+ superfamily ATPase
MTVKPIALLLLISWLCASASAALAQQEIVTLSTRAGVTLSFYLCKESETVEQMVNWMLKKPFLHEVK